MLCQDNPRLALEFDNTAVGMCVPFLYFTPKSLQVLCGCSNLVPRAFAFLVSGDSARNQNTRELENSCLRS